MNNETLASLNGTEVVSAVRNGELRAERIASAFADRIEAMNTEIGAVRDFLRDEALEQAAQIDIRRSDGEQLGPLAGMPVVVKENCDLKGVVCSAGLAFRQGNVAAADSDIVRRLRAADAILLGTSVSDPGACSTRTYEVTHPLDATLSVGGSSGGSGAALAAGMCLGAIGSDSGGSIRIPAAFCGVAGLKPSFGALPVEGVFPLAPSLDHIGPMARDVQDLALMWTAFSGQSSVDAPLPNRVGYDPAYLEESAPLVRAAIEGTIDHLRRCGIKCVETPLPALESVLGMHGTILVHEAWRVHSTRHANNLENYPDVARDWFEIAKKMPNRDYQRANALRADFTTWIDRIFANVEAILTPTMAFDVPDRAAEAICIAGKSRDFVSATVRHTCLFNHTGHPAVALPLEKAAGTAMPVSAQLIGPKNQEHSLFRLAISFGRRGECGSRSFSAG